MKLNSNELTFMGKTAKYKAFTVLFIIHPRLKSPQVSFLYQFHELFFLFSGTCFILFFTDGGDRGGIIGKVLSLMG